MKNLLKNKNLIVLITVALIAVLLYFVSGNMRGEQNSASITIDGKKIEVELAQTVEEKARGLSARASLPKEKGMLFIFDEPDKHTFWMKGMKFGLDFIWIKDGEIVDVHYNVPPPNKNTGSLPVYSPREPVDMVLEVNAGWIRDNFGNENIIGKSAELAIPQ
ncbi:MAG: DUF192 domain-containing protein [Candidatus Spechtbacterales bacterium]|nr:DUF192 domain-containing protein [Candidatus Spechtbacterales bacterium]